MKTKHPRWAVGSTAVLAGVALLFPSAAFWQASQESTAARHRAEQETKEAKLAAQQSTALNVELQNRLRCRGDFAQKLDVQVASILLKALKGGPVDLSENIVALQFAIDERAQTAERCG